MIRHCLPDVIEQENIDFVVANIENAAGGFGFTPAVYRQLIQCNIDAFTSGNHVYAKRDVMDDFDQFTCLVRPLNFPKQHPGVGVRVFNKNNHQIAVINLIGRVFMQQLVGCPFEAMDAVLTQIEADIIIVDFHAETTSEKQALGWYLADKVDIFFGTHTHVQTNDCRLISKKTGYITDLGMCGAYDSVIGMDKDISIQKFITQLPGRHCPVKSPQSLVMGGLIMKIDNQNTCIRAFNKVVE